MRPPGPPAGSPRRPRPRGAPSPGAGCVTPRLPRPPAASERLPAPSTPQPGADHKEGSALRAARIRGDPWQRPRTGPSLPAPPAPPARPRRRGRMHKARPRAPTGFHTAAGPGRRGAGGGWAGVQGRPANPPIGCVGGWRRRAEHPGSGPGPPPRIPRPAKGRGRGPGCKPGEEDVESGGGGGGTRSAQARRWRASLTPHRGERRRSGKAGAARPGSLLRTPSSPHPVVVVAGAAMEVPASRLRRAITLFHTRPTHSGNGRSGGQCAGAWGRARSPALSPLRLRPGGLSLRRRQEQTMKGVVQRVSRRLSRVLLRTRASKTRWNNEEGPRP